MCEDIKTVALNKALLKFTSKLKLNPLGKIHYGWHSKSAGQKVIGSTKPFWIQLSLFESLNMTKSYVKRIEDANNLKGINKPYLYKSFIYQEDNIFYAILLSDFVEEPLFTENSYLIKDIDLHPQWLPNLKEQIDIMSQYPTKFISCRQELITRRINERYGDISCQISSWGTIHGDLNWQNVTAITPYLLDWEGWGKGPLGLDFCFLYCFSLLAPRTANEVKTFFSDYFQSSQGSICLLFVCCELLRMTEIYKDHENLYEPLKLLGEKIVKNEFDNFQV